MKKSPLYLVNPEIISTSKKESVYEEDAIYSRSIHRINRPEACHIKLDYNGEKRRSKWDYWQLVFSMRWII